MDNTFDSEGSELFLSLDGVDIIVMDCPTGMSGYGFAAAERDSSCLSETIAKSKPGKRKLNNPTVQFRVIKGSEAHQWLFSLSEEGEANPEILYALAWSDGTADPVIVSGAFVPPGTSPTWTRTCTVGSAYVSAVSFDTADGQDVMGSFTFMPQSQKTYWKV